MATTTTIDTAASKYGGIRTIPPEILQSIFEAGHSSLNDFNNTVSHVCQQWRQVSLGTPVLWTNISVIVASPTSRAKARLYLQRSSTLPLNLHCDFASYPSDDSMERVEGIDNLLAIDIWSDLTQQSHRWFTFKFTSLNDADTIAILHVLHPLDVPVLDTIDVVVHPKERAGYGEEEPVFPKGVPSLRCLRLAGFSLIRCSLPSIEGLTQLDICVKQDQQMAVRSFLKILTGLPNLQHLSLHNALHGWPSSEHPVAELLQLRTLQLSDSMWALCRYLFLFGAPNLHKVTIHNVKNTDFPTYLYNDHNFPSVRHLSLVSSPDKEIPFHSLCKFFPHITRLSLIEKSEDKKPNVAGFLAKAHTSQSRPSLAWRDLRHLFFYPQPESAELVRTLVLGCRASGIHIKYVSLPLGGDGEGRFAGLRDIAEVNEVTNDRYAPYHINSLGDA